MISIHAPREGSDPRRRTADGAPAPISIHAPREGSDLALRDPELLTEGFLSTLPVRGATLIIRRTYPELLQFLSTLPVRGATRDADSIRERHLISIHAPREGSDLARAARYMITIHFYPRSP